MRLIDADALKEDIEQQCALLRLMKDNDELIQISLVLESGFMAQIDKMPTIEERKTGEWIPCSERLPELDEAVLATTAWNDITIAWRIGISEWFIHEGNTNAETADVLAWMPLPLPYKGEQE